MVRTRFLTPAQARRAAWIRAHPVWGSIVLGGTWGFLCSIVFMWRWCWPAGRAFAVWMGAGLILFGPILVLMDRRQQRSANGSS